ncbi:spore coat protein U domain-containing protein [Pseudochrobactrum asaccharolyticum]|uniref:spore coat protein U domain-containing protein n=1 Tax=Pseudochrobactrum asaccharolyticum TaxID=354351 RepID=UPI0040419585
MANMKSEDNFLPYKLWQAGCNIPWDDKTPLSGTGNTVNAINNHQVCAQILTPLAHAPAAGTYTDTVIVTATF